MTKHYQRERKPRIAFTLSIWQLAHGLEIIQALEPSYHPVSLNQMVKLIYQDYLAKMSILRNQVPSTKAIEEVKRMMTPKQRTNVRAARSNDQLDLQRIMQRRGDRARAKSNEEVEDVTAKMIARLQETEATKQAAQGIESELETESTSKVVTDFSPPSFEDLASD
ncbi:MAG: hypothetical protein GY845_03290 [Planctomycetes bacterium]|nr:hypothetical protein [Planctomycetota bacterium]